jgi:cellulose synthase (UDP-forming)
LRPDFTELLPLLAPTLMIVGALYVLAPMLPVARSWVRYTVFAVVWLVVGWYLGWRFFTTMLPAEGAWYEVGWLWLCFAVELLVIADQFILYVTFLRTSDHRAEADRHELRLRALRPDQLASVDVYIATYNEPMNVVELSITGALCLDYPDVRIWVLDDGRRPWLKSFCEAKGVGYLTRPDNSHAKAGNINHALTKTNAELVAIFDADFVPQRNFLMRTVGFFSSPEVGIVQVPHAFYNFDQMQSNMGLQGVIPDEQRFFFDIVMPSRDGWGAAFCCGSNSVTRRDALRAIGDKIPTQSITEDILLSMTLLRKGYVTRYLCEHLAYGLAPETVDAFFVQRQRWARGAIQILYLASGSFGRGLTPMQRLLFLPTYWVSVVPRSLFAIMVPIVFLLTGLSPLYDVTLADVIYYFVPMVLALAGGIRVFTSGRHSALTSQVQGTFLSFRLLPTILKTFFRPFGHSFMVTPKGGTSEVSNYSRGIYWGASALVGLTIIGLLINTNPEWRIVRYADAMPVLAFWSTINIVVLFLVGMMAVEAPARRTNARFELPESVSVIGPDGHRSIGVISDVSLSGAGLTTEAAGAARVGDTVRIRISEVGLVLGKVVRQKERSLAVCFILPPSTERDLLIRKLFTQERSALPVAMSTWSEAGAVLKSIWAFRSKMLDPGRQVLPSATAGPVETLPAASLVIAPRMVGSGRAYRRQALQRRIDPPDRGSSPFRDPSIQKR